MSRPASCRVVAVLSTSLTVACSDTTGPGQPPSQPPALPTPPGALPPAAALVVVEPDSVLLMVNDSLQLHATPLDSVGNATSRGAVWSSSNPAVADVTDSGFIVTHAAGDAVITATVHNRPGHTVTGTATIHVTDGCAATRRLVPGEVTQFWGSLQAGPCTEAGRHRQGWWFDVSQDGPFTLRVERRAFDPVVVLTDSDLNVLAIDDDSGGGTDAELTLRLRPGRYHAWVTSSEPGATGTYSGRLALSGPPQPPAMRPIAVGETVADRVHANGTHYWQLTLAAGGRVEIRSSGTGDSHELVLLESLRKRVLSRGVGIAHRGGTLMRQDMESGSYVIEVRGPVDLGWPCLVTCPGSADYVVSVSGAAPERVLGIGIGDSLTVGMIGQQPWGGHPADLWQLHVEAATRIEVSAGSAAFIPTLAVTDMEWNVLAMAERGPIGPLPRAVEIVAQPGRYLVWVVSETGQAGSYTIHARSLDACNVAGPVAAGDAVAGVLTDSPCIYGTTRYALHSLDVTAAGLFDLVVTSDAASPWLRFHDSTRNAVRGHVVRAGDGVRARLWLEPGRHFFEVTAQGTGSYTLAAERVGPNGSVAPGVTATATLADGVCPWFNASEGPCDVWWLDLPALDWWEIEAGGNPVDIIILDDAGHELDAPRTGVSRQLLGPGRYRLLVAGTAGSTYELAVDRLLDYLPCAAVRAIVPGEKHESELTGDTCTRHDYRYEGWRLDITETAMYEIAAAPSGLMMFGAVPPVLVVASEGRVVPGTRPGGSRQGDAVSWVRLAPGEHELWVSSRGSGAPGAYTIMVQHTEGCPARAIAVDESVAESIIAGPCSRDGRHFAAWRFDVAEADRFRIDLESDEFDAYLILSDSTGQVHIAQDDDGGAGTDAALVTELDDGSYVIWASSYAHGELGRYRLTIRRAAAGDAVPAGEEAAGGMQKATVPRALPRLWAAPP